MTRGQAMFAGLIAAAVASGLLLEPSTTGAALIGSFTLAFVATTGLRLYYLVRGYRQPAAGTSLPLVSERELPTYSILVPLYREANVLRELMVALDRLDYPFDRLEVVFLVEEADTDTVVACQRQIRPGWRVLVVPEGEPRTKPRALNHGLPLITGEFLTIYDAEDRPDRDQLRRAVAEFRALPNHVACLQARLDYYNADQNLLTRWFTCEYATHFGLYLEGIAAARHPLPLGGTSSHFRTEVIKDLGGWDEWNVTEDCELGMRLAAAGYESRVLDSVTWEEAVPVLRGWVKQRSRWVKGFAQTGLVLARAPLRMGLSMGPCRYLAALVTVAGLPVVLLSQVFFWALLWVYVGLRAGGGDVGMIESLFPEPLLSLGMISLLVGNYALLLSHVSAVYQQGRYQLVRYALLTPFYWLLMSVGAWKGVAQLTRRPHFWEKTPHGLTRERPTFTPARPATLRFRAAGIAARDEEEAAESVVQGIGTD